MSRFYILLISVKARMGLTPTSFKKINWPCRRLAVNIGCLNNWLVGKGVWVFAVRLCTSLPVETRRAKSSPSFKRSPNFVFNRKAFVDFEINSGSYDFTFTLGLYFDSETENSHSSQIWFFFSFSCQRTSCFLLGFLLSSLNLYYTRERHRDMMVYLWV